MVSLRTIGRADFGKPSKSDLITGKKTVTVASTAEQLASNAIPSGYDLVIKALADNTSPVHIATTKANAENDAVAYQLNKGETVTVRITNTNLIWVDANTSGEGITFIAEKS